MTSNGERVERGELRVAEELDRFVATELLPDLQISIDRFWGILGEVVGKYADRNAELLAHRDALQAQLDVWHAEHHGTGDVAGYADFLREIGYLEPEPAPFSIGVEGVDPEIALVAGPQLVVPLNNARFALNACNARWGSLYDALYGSDVIPEQSPPGAGYDPARGSEVFTYVAGFLDEALPLDGAGHASVVEYVVDGAVSTARLADGTSVTFGDVGAFVGSATDGGATRLLFVHHGLHIELVVDRAHPIGGQHPAGVADVVLEAAVTTIQDCEDSVAAVDAQDKVAVYRNWLGLMTGTLEATFPKGGGTLTRRLAEDRQYTTPDGGTVTLPGRSLLLLRNVGLHMTTDAVTTADGGPIPEGLLDAVVTVTGALYDLRRLGTVTNSRTGSIYIVKPKLHGSAEVAFTAEVFSTIESLLDLPPNTVKLGIMDEERRTTLNLAAAIAAARERVIFINTGFLDRTGDEIHTAMAAGPVVRKGEMRSARWLGAYELHNVDVALATGFRGRAQIGKGMWAMPDAMAEMVATKIAHPRAGATCAWVPSPTAATLHSLHYHLVDVAARQTEIAAHPGSHLDDLLCLPLLERDLSDDEVTDELRNNAQSILGYVVRWVNQGVGCSKVPDIHGVALMEDRATLRISSQHIANWLTYGILDRERVIATFLEMAALVDAQNAGDPEYSPMLPDPAHSAGVQASLDLVFSGTTSPNGYTEEVLDRWRSRVKAGTAG
jgi:malate synthase